MVSNNTIDKTAQRSSVEQRLTQMVERKWRAVNSKHDDNPITVRTTDEHVSVGPVSGFNRRLMMQDVIRECNRDCYEFRYGYHEETERSTVNVRPISISEKYHIPDGLDVRLAIPIKALDEAGIHAPRVAESGYRASILQYFETEQVAERVATAIEPHVESALEEMWSWDIEEIEVRRLDDPRVGLDDSWYALWIHYE